MRRVLLALAVLPALVAAYLAAALLGAFWPAPAAGQPGAPEVVVGLAAGPIHYDFLLPLTPELRSRFGFAEAAGVPVTHPAAEWLVVGWGAREFYTTVGTYRDLTVGAVWRGIAGDASVMRISAIGPIREPSAIDWIGLTRAEFAALLDAIETGFARDAAGRPEAITASGQGGAFFAGAGRFHIGRTCNVWVGEMLRAAGLRFGRWTPTPYAVRLSLWRFAPPGPGRPSGI